MTQTALIFVSGNTWDEHVAQGYRTRQGALLRAFASSGRYDRMFLFVETGFRGSRGTSEKKLPNQGTDITEVLVPGRLPESIMRPMGNSFLTINYIYPKKVIKELANYRVELILSYSSGSGAFLRQKTGAPFLFDVIDFRIQDANLSVRHNRSIQSQIKIGCQTADFVSCNSPAAFPILNQWSKGSSYMVRNGVELERFENLPKTGPRKGVGFVGAISNWTDFLLIETLLECFPDAEFHFYGIIQLAAERLQPLRHYRNFHWHGKLEPNQVPAFMTSCRAGIVPYDPTQTWHTTGDAMKVFEFLAAGTPVISTAFQPQLYERFERLATVCNSHSEFVEQLGMCLSKEVDHDWQEEAWKFVKQNTWKHRVDQILEIAKEYGSP